MGSSLGEIFTAEFDTSVGWELRKVSRVHLSESDVERMDGGREPPYERLCVRWQKLSILKAEMKRRRRREGLEENPLLSHAGQIKYYDINEPTAVFNTMSQFESPDGILTSTLLYAAAFSE